MLYKRGNVWWAKIKHRGGTVRRSTGSGTKEAAQRFHDELAARLWNQRERGRTLEDALVAWLKLRPRGRSDVNAVAQISAALGAPSLVDATEALFVCAFGDKKPSTFNRLANVYRSALATAQTAGWIEKAPQISRRKERPVDFRFIKSAEEWERLRAELPAHLEPMAAFALATGLRWSNVAKLEWDRVDLRARRAWIQASKAKAGRPIGVPLNSDAIAALQRAGDHRSGFVFLYNGHPINSPKTAWNKAVKRAGLDGLHWHDLRHTWASWHVMQGTPMAVLKELGAWETPTMVARYAHLAPGHADRYAENAKPPKAA